VPPITYGKRLFALSIAHIRRTQPSCSPQVPVRPFVIFYTENGNSDRYLRACLRPRPGSSSNDFTYKIFKSFIEVLI
jgi:hypothetical protein